MEYGAVLISAIRSAPRESTDLDVIHQTPLAGVRYNEQPEARARQLIAKIVLCSTMIWSALESRS
jgi:hypothetical protein